MMILLKFQFIMIVILHVKNAQKVVMRIIIIVMNVKMDMPSQTTTQIIAMKKKI